MSMQRLPLHLFWIASRRRCFCNRRTSRSAFRTAAVRAISAARIRAKRACSARKAANSASRVFRLISAWRRVSAAYASLATCASSSRAASAACSMVLWSSAAMPARSCSVEGTTCSLSICPSPCAGGEPPGCTSAASATGSSAVAAFPSDACSPAGCDGTMDALPRSALLFA